MYSETNIWKDFFLCFQILFICLFIYVALGIELPEITNTPATHPNTKLHAWFPDFFNRH